MATGTIILTILTVALLGIIPIWPYSRKWGYAPTGGVVISLLILLVLDKV